MNIREYKIVCTLYWKREYCLVLGALKQATQQQNDKWERKKLKTETKWEKWIHRQSEHKANFWSHSPCSFYLFETWLCDCRARIKYFSAITICSCVCGRWWGVLEKDLSSRHFPDIIGMVKEKNGEPFFRFFFFFALSLSFSLLCPPHLCVWVCRLLNINIYSFSNFYLAHKCDCASILE